MLNIKVDIDLSGMQKKFSPANLALGQIAMANQMLSDIDDFVPYREGTLSQTATATPDGKELHYNTPYARYVYYGDAGWNWTRDFHPQAGPKWDEVASGMFIEDWKRAYVEGAKLNA